MTKQEFVENYSVDEWAIFIGYEYEWDIYKKAIIGVTEDRCHIVYSYNKLIESLADSYMKENYNKGRDYLSEATEWIEYNTIRSLPYLPSEYKPIIIYDVEGL
jgi:hypothetical protein